MTIWYCPLEPYEERYTSQLFEWTRAAFERRGVPYEVITGQDTWQPDNGNSIQTGVALDAHFRSLWGLAQMQRLIEHLQRGLVKSDDVIYFQDLFQPGFDALLYVLQQQFLNGTGPRIFTWCHAQTFDPDDFTAKWGPAWWNWMRDYETMVGKTAFTFVSASGLKELMHLAGYPGNVAVVGHPFDSKQVRSYLPRPPRPLAERSKAIVWTSRFDAEKQPHFFLDLVPVLADQGYEVAILTGAPALRSNDPFAVERANAYAHKGVLKIFTGLSKRQYYDLLADARLQFNCARQDWVSYTLLEASALGTPTLAPAFRSFPEALFNDERQLFVPWSRDDAIAKAIALLQSPPPPSVITRPAQYHDGSLDRILDLLLS